MSRTLELLMHSARRAEQLSPPIDGDFLREHDVSIDEMDALQHSAAVALAGYAKLATINSDLHSLLILVGVLALDENVDDDFIKGAVSNLKAKQILAKTHRYTLGPL